MSSLALSGAGFTSRTVGGIASGTYSHRLGRRPAMMLSFMMMGSAIVVMALIPSYAQIGIAAPILAVIARMVQGFSLGGEVGPTTAYLLESAPAKSRGLAVSWQAATGGPAPMPASLVGFGLAATLSASALSSYGWRIAFLLGAVTLPFGLWIRRSVPETLHRPETHTVSASKAVGAMGVLRENARVITLGLVVLASGTIGTYVFNYLATFAQGTLNMSASAAFAGSVAQNAVALVTVLFGGWLSDRIGRRPVMIVPRLAVLLLLLPDFYWIVDFRKTLTLIHRPSPGSAVNGI